LIEAIYPDEVIALRALIAPWPDFDFRSLRDEWRLWVDGAALSADDTRLRDSHEYYLRQFRENFQSRDQPFFLSPNTGGKLVSLYPDVLTDAEYWCFYMEYALDDEADGAMPRLMENWRVLSLGMKSTIEFLRAEKSPTPWMRWQRWWKRNWKREKAWDPKVMAWGARHEILYPNYL
jgi:hypothetical protein